MAISDKPSKPVDAQAVVQRAVRAKVKPRTQITVWISQHWLLVFSVFYGLFVGLPFLAPVFMQIGWVGPGRAIYLIYTVLCHQLPQRSFFLFGSEVMYDIPTIQGVWENAGNPLVLRQFIGNSAMGWKVAWSDRMVSMYTSILIFGLLWYPFRQRIRGLPLWGLILFTLPMILDGSSHFVSDLAGLGQGFRYTNDWLLELTGGVFSPEFYAGNGIGSFNSWMRFLTGVLFGLGVVWFTFPILDQTARQTLRLAGLKLRSAGIVER